MLLQLEITINWKGKDTWKRIDVLWLLRLENGVPGQCWTTAKMRLDVTTQICILETLHLNELQTCPRHFIQNLRKLKMP